MNKAKELFRQFFDKPIAYHRIYADITKGFDTGVLLSQINYWWKTMNYKPFYKSEDSFCGELYMTKYQFRQAKDTLIALNCISVERKGLPARLYYTVNEEVIIESTKKKFLEELYIRIKRIIKRIKQIFLPQKREVKKNILAVLSLLTRRK